MTLTLLDWLIIGGYFVVSLAIGLLLSGRAGKSLTEYFVSGRSLPWWIAGTSMVATTFAADTPLAVTGLTARHGLAGNWFWFAFALGGMLTVFVYARLWRRAEVVTDVELVEMRYSGRPASFLRGFRALYLVLIINPIIIGWVTGAMVKILKYTVLAGSASAGAAAAPTGIAADWLLITLCLGVVGVYATLAGLWGVAVTDFLQFILAMTGCILLAVIAVDHLGGMDAMQAEVARQFGGQQAFRYLPDFFGTDPWMPIDIFLIMLLVQWWATWYPGAEPGGGGFIVQRMASCRSERDSVLATLWFQVAHYCVRPWPWLLVAFAALAMYPELRTADDPDAGFPMVIRDLAPPGLRGLMLVTFFAAFMSTISTQMNWGASYLVNDVYARFFAKGASDRHLAWAARIASVIVLGIGGLAAWWMRDMTVDEAWKFLAALGAGTGAVFLLRWFWWRINAWTEISAMAASLLIFAIVQSRVETNEYRMAIVAGLTILVWVLVTLATPPESRETLIHFYRKIHPGGPGWKPIARQAPDVVADRNLAESLLAALCAAGIVYLTIPGVGGLILGSYLEATFCLLAAAGCAAAVWLLVRRMQRRGGFYGRTQN